MSEDETTFWKGSPSQWLNIGPFSVAILLAGGIVAGGIFFPPAFIGLLIPAIYALWSYLTVRCQTFELTTERLRVTKGVINQNIDEVELYRVKDMVVERKWWMRITGLGNVHLETSDRSMPHVDIPAIRDSIGLRGPFGGRKRQRPSKQGASSRATATARTLHNGTFPCLRLGRSSRLESSMARPEMSLMRVSAGSMTSSM